jgi:shikimate dehydrogenase
MKPPISGTTVVAGVAGQPIGHSLSPRLHNAWLEAGEIDGVYVAFAPAETGFERFCEGLRGGVVRGLNVTAPFKETTLALADQTSERARAAGSANLILFEPDGRILADSTDGEGLLRAFVAQAPRFDPRAAPVVILGAGGAARAAAAAMAQAGAPQVWLANRTPGRAQAAAEQLGGPVRGTGLDSLPALLASAGAVIHATPAGRSEIGALDIDLTPLQAGAVVMDMTYRPLRTPLLEKARALGLATVDGLAMLIGQAEPSFTALFGAPVPPIDVRPLAEDA